MNKSEFEVLLDETERRVNQTEENDKWFATLSGEFLIKLADKSRSGDKRCRAICDKSELYHIGLLE